jgi:hypothetical protein
LKINLLKILIIKKIYRKNGNGLKAGTGGGAPHPPKLII